MLSRLNAFVPPAAKAWIVERARKGRSIMKDPRRSFFLLSKDVRSRLGFYSYRERIVFVAGLPKSGTTWVENFLYHVPGLVPRELGGDQSFVIEHGVPPDAFKAFPRGSYSYVKTHADPTPQNIEVLANSGIGRILILIRDPRDVAVSRYFHLLKVPKGPAHPDHSGYRYISKDEGMTNSIRIVCEYYCPWIRGWSAEAERHPGRYLVLEYRSLREDPVAAFSRVSEFFGFGLDRAAIENILKKAKARPWNADKAGKAGQISTFRKGEVGDWRNHFNADHVKVFKELGGRSLVEFGYEKDINW